MFTRIQSQRMYTFTGTKHTKSEKYRCLKWNIKQQYTNKQKHQIKQNGWKAGEKAEEREIEKHIKVKNQHSFNLKLMNNNKTW